MRRAFEFALAAGAAACLFRAGQAWAETPRPVVLRFRHVIDPETARPTWVADHGR